MRGTLLKGEEASVGNLWDAEPGSYFPMRNPVGRITYLWFKLPTGSVGRIANQGCGHGEPEWQITEDNEGIITVEPSIQQNPVPGSPDHPATEAWHGYLRAGEWTGA